jgi:hypothetical protein
MYAASEVSPASIFGYVGSIGSLNMTQFQRHEKCNENVGFEPFRGSAGSLMESSDLWHANVTKLTGGQNFRTLALQRQPQK